MLKIEVVAVGAGLVSVAVTLVLTFFWSSFPGSVHAQFYGGEPGAFVVGTGILAAIFGSVLFVVNLFRKQFSLWWVRLLAILAFYLGAIVVGATGI